MDKGRYRNNQKQEINIDNSEEMNIVMIPKNEHNNEKYMKAKYTVLEKLKEFDTKLCKIKGNIGSAIHGCYGTKVMKLEPDM